MTKIFRGTLHAVREQITRLLDQKADRQNGIDSRAASTISFTDATRTFSITPTGTTFDYFVRSKRYTSTGETLVIPANEGLHYIYFDDDGVLVSTQTFSEEIITRWAFLSVVYWDAFNNESILFADERHGADMDSATHIYNHVTFGTRYERGLRLSNMQVDGTGGSNADAQIGVADGAIWDEDIRHNIVNGSPQTLSPIAQIPMFYRVGASGDWRRVAANNYPVSVNTVTGLANFNEFSGALSSWGLTSAGSNNFVLTHLFAIGDARHPIIGIVGQAEYATSSQARDGAVQELLDLEIGQLDILSPEFVPIATLIWQTRTSYTNDVASRIVSTDTGNDYISWLPKQREPNGADAA